MRHLKNSPEACHLSFSHLISNLTVKMLLLPIEILYMIFKRLNYNDAQKLALALASAADPQTRVTTARSLYRGHDEVVELLLENPRVDPSAEDNYAIRKASQAGEVEVVKLLLKDPRVDPSANYNDAIGIASRNGHHKVVELLLNDPRVDPTDEANEAIRMASYQGHHKVVEILVKDPRVDPSAGLGFARHQEIKQILEDAIKERVL